ncbi:MAG: hypothetical protein EBR40_09280 [Proteobacteria bacterium]|nr:hypothetical protein [Pseudomonadota bacterium]
MAVIGNRPAPSFYADNDLSVACGLGIRGDTALTPKYNGIPVEQNVLYGFSCRFKGDRLTSAATAGIYWFDRNELFLGSSSSTFLVSGEWQTLLVQGLSIYGTNASIQMLAGTGYGSAFTATVGDSLLVAAGEGVGVAPDAGVYANEFRKYLPENARRTVYAEYSGAAFAVPYITVSNRQQGDIFTVMGAMFYEVGDGGTTTAVAPDFFLTLGTSELIGEDSGKIMGG